MLTSWLLQKKLTLYLLIVVRKEGLLYPLNGCCIQNKIKKKEITEYICIGCIWHVGLFKNTGWAESWVSAVNRVVEETISIGMHIPRRKVRGQRREEEEEEEVGGLSILYVWNNQSRETRGGWNWQNPSKKRKKKSTFFHFVQLLSLRSIWIHRPNSGTGGSDRCVHTVRDQICKDTHCLWTCHQLHVRFQGFLKKRTDKFFF